MSEAEKEARRLVELFYELPVIWATAKECALIAVEEIIKALHKADTAYDLIPLIEHWQQVKAEIEKL